MLWYSNTKFSGILNQRFENDVKMYGTQTGCMVLDILSPFENDVKMYGTQTIVATFLICNMFENDVKMYGTQTNLCIS